MLSTGLQKLDGLLSGGIPECTITDIFGSNGTGKTQLLFQLSLNATKKNHRVLYVDTSGSFRPERIVRFQKNDSTIDILDRIAVLRVTNTHEQMRSLQTIHESDFDLVLVDNVTDLFSYEYQSKEQIFEKNLLFTQYMYGLSLHAISKKIPVVITNMVRQLDYVEVENMHTAIDLFTHIKIHLSRSSPNFSGEVAWLEKSFSFSYNICPDGLADAAEYI